MTAVRPPLAVVARETLVVLAYVGVSFLYFGRFVASHPGRDVLGSSQDPLIFIWSFAWWPHALFHGTNPIVTHALFAPQGFNLMWATSVPGLAFAFAPLTWLAGPVASYNVAMVVLPAAAAWAAYRLCLELTGSVWASLVGGYLYGFSSYMVGHELHGHVNLTGVFVVPLLALVLVRFFRRRLTRRRLAVWLGVLIAFQISISTEVAVAMTLVLALGLALAAVAVAEARPIVRTALAPIVAGYALAVVLLLPLVIFAFLGFTSTDLSGGARSGTDLLDALVPTPLNGIAGTLFPSVSAKFELEDGLYLGLPALVIVVLLAWSLRRSAWGRFLLLAFLLLTAITLGTALRIDGNRIVSLPPRLARHLPALDNVHWDRCAVYLALCGAVAVAVWTARTPGRIYPRPFVLPVLAVAAVVPGFWRPYYPSHHDRWPFYTAGLYRSCLRPGEIDLVFPWGYAGDSMLWQAESGFRFSLAEGYLHAVGAHAPILSGLERDPVAQELANGSQPTMGELRAFAARNHIAHVIATSTAGYPTARQLRAFGPVQRIGGVFVAPACGRPSLTG